MLYPHGLTEAQLQYVAGELKALPTRRFSSTGASSAVFRSSTTSMESTRVRINTHETAGRPSRHGRSQSSGAAASSYFHHHHTSSPDTASSTSDPFGRSADGLASTTEHVGDSSAFSDGNASQNGASEAHETLACQLQAVYDMFVFFFHITIVFKLFIACDKERGSDVSDEL
jgi:hypothetical protein